MSSSPSSHATTARQPVVERGEVYMADIPLPNRQGRSQPQIRRKLAVVLQGGQLFAAAEDVAVVISSSDRGTGGRRPFEVLLDRQDGLDHDTIVDCRWPFTLPKRVIERGELKATLDPGKMHQISVALIAGLELR